MPKFGTQHSTPFHRSYRYGWVGPNWEKTLGRDIPGRDQRAGARTCPALPSSGFTEHDPRDGGAGFGDEVGTGHGASRPGGRSLR